MVFLQPAAKKKIDTVRKVNKPNLSQSDGSERLKKLAGKYYKKMKDWFCSAISESLRAM